MDESEWRTRKERIDRGLRQCNPPWKILAWKAGLEVRGLACHAVTEFPTANGPADYALFAGGKLLGIIEAKKVTVNPQNVLEQAERYAEGASEGPGNWNGFRVPFLYVSNGEIIWHLDVRPERSASRTIGQFHTGPAMEAMFGFNPKGAPGVSGIRHTPKPPIRINHQVLAFAALGHENLNTTHQYVEADLAMKERALETLKPPKSKRHRFHPASRLLQFLDGL